MPNYAYECKLCGYTFEEQLLMKDRTNPTKDKCPNCGEYGVSLSISVPNIIDPYLVSTKKVPNGFKEVLSNIKNNNKGSTIDI